MKKKNKQFLYLLLIGWLGVIIGAGLKISGNPNYEFALGTALVIELIALTFLFWFNLTKIKSFFS
tara:strand:+ start:3196 stop:3390 length:195 start_codon:yes stop_codon:yes gene_type:complete